MHRLVKLSGGKLPQEENLSFQHVSASSPPTLPRICPLECADQISNKNHFLTRMFQMFNRILTSYSITLFTPKQDV